MNRPPLLISACLLGRPCRYDGGTKGLEPEWIAGLEARYTLVPVCPECLGGLPIPRCPSERRGERVVMRDGTDVTAQFHRGAGAALETARANGCALALLKERSPSCGAGAVYDGSFTGTVVPGDGVAAALLRENGLRLFGESRIAALLDDAEN